jgi:glucosamine 6-phosphate synthetase-like amidotransferase/phosphosugar isomerase protein
MCGIIGYVGSRPCQRLLLEGLRRLEYPRYDSAGIAWREAEVRARGAQVLAIASEGYDEVAEHAEHVIYIPNADPLLQVVLGIVPLQLFAYHHARRRGLNVRQARNLAKTVTVE